MKKQRTASVITNVRWGALFVVVLFLVIPVTPHALGQRSRRDISKRTSHVEAPSHADGGTWIVTGSLNPARYLHTASLLPSGLVLAAGGSDSSFTVSPSAELYDSATYTWTVTGSLNTPRMLHTATL